MVLLIYSIQGSRELTYKKPNEHYAFLKELQKSPLSSGLIYLTQGLSTN